MPTDRFRFATVSPRCLSSRSSAVSSRARYQKTSSLRSLLITSRPRVPKSERTIPSARIDSYEISDPRTHHPKKKLIGARRPTRSESARKVRWARGIEALKRPSFIPPINRASPPLGGTCAPGITVATPRWGESLPSSRVLLSILTNGPERGSRSSARLGGFDDIYASFAALLTRRPYRRADLTSRLVVN
jgi:hypothetical protein